MILFLDQVTMVIEGAEFQRSKCGKGCPTTSEQISGMVGESRRGTKEVELKRYWSRAPTQWTEASLAKVFYLDVGRCDTT